MKIIKFIFNILLALFCFKTIINIINRYQLLSALISYFIISIHSFLIFKDRKNFTKDIITSNYHHFTLIVPVKNEEDNIIQTLDNIKNISYPNQNYKVLIINDNSTDNTWNLLNSLDLPENFKLINRKRTQGFVSGVLNDAIKKINFKTDIIGIVDADCMVSHNLLKILNIKFQKYIGGIQIQEWHYNQKNNLIKAQHLGIIYENFKMLKEPYFKVGHFFSYDLVNKIKYNEKSILEDMELSNMILDLNYPVEVISDVLIYRTLPDNIKSIYSQQYRYALGLNMIYYKKKIIHTDIILGLFLVFSFLYTLINFQIIYLFLFLNFLGTIIIIMVNQYYFFDTYYSALNNSPSILRPLIKNQNKISFLDIINTQIYHCFLLILRLISYFRLAINNERIVWNRFS